jgi:hypothetical protein
MRLGFNNEPMPVWANPYHLSFGFSRRIPLPLISEGYEIMMLIPDLKVVRDTRSLKVNSLHIQLAELQENYLQIEWKEDIMEICIEVIDTELIILDFVFNKCLTH